MPNLRSYSCPECGSFLEVDRNKDTFDCPFCGKHFDALDFHGKELFEQANKYLEGRQYELAKKKFEYLLSQDPENFDFLWGYACAVGGLSDLKPSGISQNYSVKLIELLKNDERYKNCDGAEYFAKFAEHCSICNEYCSLTHEKIGLENAAREGIKKIDGSVKIGCGTCFGYLVIHFIFVYALNIMYSASTNSRLDSVPYHLYVYGLPILVCVLILWIPAMNVEPEKKVVPSIISKNSFLIKDEPFVDTEEAKEILKSAICAKCGAELALDKDRKLFVCNHCGVTYNYSLFIGDPLTKANTDLKNSEFKLADKRYAGILKETPGDFVANRGRVLCACKFRGFTEAKLDTAFKDVDWEAVDNALDFAIQNSNVMTEEYFTELKELLGTARTYCEKCEKIKALKKEAFIRPELSVYSEQKDELYDTYYDIMSYFSVRDRKLIVAVNNPERVSSDVLYLRTRMLKIGSWNSISSIVPGDEHNDKLNDAFMFAMEAVKQTEFPYKEYFELCRQYFLFVRDHSQEDEVFKQRQNELVNADKRLFPGKNKN